MTSAGITPRTAILAATPVAPRQRDRMFAGRPEQIREARKFLSAVLATLP